ncbi:putative ribosome biogenesis protein C8F11.04 [Hypsizygus marmoreus]|uniref:Ribosomal L1 domain-containing protein 1 n=1 Tax=Hypsizygus marmoreus TaxID=39966 RepID=A0A369JHT5_HYPMA|nr:putative ribosome biogenesis protein C8F11.04 [Hypsizygus marmoreus]
MAKLIDSRVSVKQCKLAIDALHAHESKKEQKLQESELLPGKEPNIWLNVTVKKIPSGHKFKPVKIPIAHPLVDPRTTPICLITKDPQREYKDLLETHKIKFISRVVGIEKLKGKFKPFEARRMLLKENGLFLADERIVPLLPKLLGVKWFEAKKQPIPVCLKRKDLKAELERAISSTYMNQNQGTCTSIKIGTLSQKPTHILANLETALPIIANHIQGGWENIQALHIKTNSSVSLPIWTCNLDEGEGGRWNGLTAAALDEEGSDEDSDAERMEVEIEEKKTVTPTKGKKRAQEDEEVEKPKKKAKGAKGDAVTEPVPTKAKTFTKTSATTLPQETGKQTATKVDTPPRTKKQKTLGSKALSAPSAAEPTDDIPKTSPSSSKKQSRKSTSTVDITETLLLVTPVATTSPAVEGKNQRKKKARLSAQASDSVRATKPTEESGPKKKEAKGDAPPDTLDEAPVVKKEKRAKKGGDIATAETTSIPLTKAELKQKRGTGPGEKKKGKIVSSGSKSAKDGILGKKVAQG